MSKSFVIGGGGFIGSHLVDALVHRGPVTIMDRARSPYIDERLGLGWVRFIQADILEMSPPVAGHDVVFHLAANPEAREGIKDPSLDLHQGTIATHRVLEACRLAGVPKLVFASSGAIYGTPNTACEEDIVKSLPISLYAASKLACEAMISAYVECFGLQAYVCRFGNVVGPRATHGVILDLLRQLAVKPKVLRVLGDGTQIKPYLHVYDCVAGMLHVLDRAPDKLNVYNLAPPDATTVRYIAEECVAVARPGTPIEYGATPQGWPGDVPSCRMVPDKLTRLGFRVRRSSIEAVDEAVRDVAREVMA